MSISRWSHQRGVSARMRSRLAFRRPSANTTDNASMRTVDGRSLLRSATCRRRSQHLGLLAAMAEADHVNRPLNLSRAGSHREVARRYVEQRRFRSRFCAAAARRTVPQLYADSSGRDQALMPSRSAFERRSGEIGQQPAETVARHRSRLRRIRRYLGFRLSPDFIPIEIAARDRGPAAVESIR